MQSKTPTALRSAGLAALAGAALLCASLATAQTPPKAKPATKPADKLATFGKGKPTGKLLTRAELRECLATQDSQHTKRQGLMQLEKELDREKSEITVEALALKTALETLDRDSVDEVEAHNARAAAQGKRIDDYNERNGTLVANAQTWETVQEGWSAACANRPYREEDENAIKRGQ